jgi:hypothetical protein
MQTENIERLIKMVQHLNPESNEIGLGMIAMLQQTAERAEQEISDIAISSNLRSCGD